MSIRLPEAHRCPALLKAESKTHLAAFSRSASSQTMRGFLPPSSRETLASRSPAMEAICRPTAVEPVKLMTSTSALATRGAPASSPKPWMILRTPGGKPTSWAILPKNQAVAGVSSAALRTAVSADQGGKNLPGHIGDGRVGCNDQAGHADGLPDGHGIFVWHGTGGGSAVHPTALTCHEHP